MVRSRARPREDQPRAGRAARPARARPRGGRVLSGSESITPTALYTGHVWSRGGLSHPALATTRGRLLFDALEPANRLSRALGGPTLEDYLIARHRAIDALLTHGVESGRVAQVVEIAAGLSPRGWRFTERYGERLTYIEADLPHMAERKRRALAQMGSLGRRHRVQALDALRDTGPGSLTELAGGLDRRAGLAIVTEGLLGYLPTDAVLALWGRLAETLGDFRHGLYISDLHLGSAQSPPVHAFRLALSVFVRGRVHLHFGSADEARAALRGAGFTTTEVHRAGQLAAGVDGSWRGKDPGSRLAHIIEASTT